MSEWIKQMEEIDYSKIILTPHEQELAIMEAQKKKYFHEKAKERHSFPDKEYCGKDYYDIRAGHCPFAYVYHGNIVCKKCDQR